MIEVLNTLKKSSPGSNIDEEILKVFPDQVSPRLSIFATVRRLKEQRYGMVKTAKQYGLLYKLMAYWIGNCV